jgi:hypothetical protein
MQGMIQSGAFGGYGPMTQSTPFNPYQNNIIQFGGYGVYNQPNIQQQQYYNPYQVQQQPQNNGFIFQPPQVAYQQPQQQNYYDPYGNTFSQQSPYGYAGGCYSPYGNTYNGYANYRPFYSPVAQAQYQSQQVELFKMKYRIANYYVGNEIDEDYLDRLCNPNNPANQKSEEQIKFEEETKFMNYLSDVANGRIPQAESQAQRDARILNLMSKNKHEALDNHSLCQFLEEDLWRLQQEEWIRKNVKVNASRDLSNVYSSTAYNELLKLHNSSSSAYVNDILNDSRYDNNADDIEIGMNLAFEKERRRKAILEGKVPTYISSDETQRARHEWTKALMDQICRKGSGSSV